MTNKKPIKMLSVELNEKINEQIKARRENLQRYRHDSVYLGYDIAAFLPVGGYALHELKNNKPLTLLEAKEKYKTIFVCFVAIRSYRDGENCFTCFDINESKKTTSPIKALEMFFSGWGDPRKDGERIAILTNKNISLYFDNVKKHIRRCEEKSIFNKNDKFLYCDEDFSLWERKTEKQSITLYGFSYNSLTKTEFDSLSCAYITIGGEKINHNCKTRQELYSFMFDKNGYFKLYYQLQLKKAADNVREQKRQEAERIARDNFIKDDKKEIIDSINKEIALCIFAIHNLLNYEKIMCNGAIKCLETLKENIVNLQDLKNNINDYGRYNNPYARIEEKIKESHDIYIIALTLFNNNDKKTFSPSCYKIEDDNIIAIYEWCYKDYPDHMTKAKINLSI